MFFKLSLRNVKRQVGNYLVYFITVSLTIALLFSINNIIFSDLMSQLQEAYFRFLQPLFLCISGVLSVIVAFALGYATSYLLRRRKKEFGLYLSMGMTRGNILSIFACEMSVTFLLSLGMGVLIGLLLYQGMMTIFINYMEVNVKIGGYSLLGCGVTVLMVCVIFAIASFFSLLYLKYARISRLLHGEKIVEKTVKRPYIWLAVAVLSLVVLIVSGVVLGKVFIEGDLYWELPKLLTAALFFMVSIILLHIGIAKSVVPVCLKSKKFSSRGTRTFTLRQLSGRLNVNSVMAGVLALLLSLALIGTDVFMSQKSFNEAQLNARYSFDITGSYYSSWSESEKSDSPEFSFEDAVDRIKDVVDISGSHVFDVYKTGSHDLNDQVRGYNGDYVLRESDYKKLCAILGQQPGEVKEDGYLLCWNSESLYNELGGTDFSDIRLNVGDVSYSLADVAVNNLIFPFDAVVDIFAVLSDSVAEKLDVSYHSLAILLKNKHYDVNEVSTLLCNGYGRVNINMREAERLDALGQIALVLLGDLSVSAVFVLLSMALLALKMLSMLTEDKERFRALWRLGADEGMIRKSLFAQMFFFYLLPFCVPILLSIPVGIVLSRIAILNNIVLAPAAIFTQVAGMAIILLALYILYFLVTYLIAWRDVKTTLHSVG